MEPLGPHDPRQVGQYRLRAVLGSGGMGRVFLGLSPGGFAVAVKVIHPELARDPQFCARFAREVDAARRVSGAYTAPVVDAGVDDEPPWLATAFVVGPSLAEAVTAGGALPDGAVLRLAAGLAEALAAVHGCGLVHRDLKPRNVLLAADGPRVIDFGIARALDGTAVTGTGIVLGSPGFMSPEQAEGGPVGSASDVFALGCVLAFAATGAAPFGVGSPIVVQYRVAHAEPALDGMIGPLRDLVAGCLAKDPAGRPALAGLLQALASHRVPDEAAFPASFWPEPLAGLIRSHQAPPGVPPPDQDQPLARNVAVEQATFDPTELVRVLAPQPRRPRRSPFRNPGVIAVAVVAVAVAVFGANAAIGKLTSSSASAAGDPSGQRPPTSVPGFTLRYTQEFTGHSLPADWHAYTGVAGGQAADVAAYEPGMCSVSGGEAHFMASGIDSCGMEFTGVPQKYGAYFARIKGDSEPPDIFFSDVFLLWPVSNKGWPKINIYQDDGASRNRTYALMFNNVNGYCGADPTEGCLEQFAQTNSPEGVANNGTEWHTYGLEWTPSGVKWLIDGMVIYVAPASAVRPPALQPATPMDMVLQSENLRGAGTPTKRETMTVAWVAQFSYNG
jgi:serine/threonine protein kinase